MNYRKYAEAVSGRNWDGLLYETGSYEKIMLVLSGSDGGLQYAGKAARFLFDYAIPAYFV
jgi:hypothetical protein